jgi:hypothetical protein
MTCGKSVVFSGSSGIFSAKVKIDVNSKNMLYLELIENLVLETRVIGLY